MCWEAVVIAGMLVLNAVLSLPQEGRAQQALALLRQQLHVRARVRRDGAWTTLPAEGLVTRRYHPFALKALGPPTKQLPQFYDLCSNGRE